jgi:Uma2 family endonuclease
VVEIASPGTRRRDETIKRQLYDRSEVQEYWVVDPDANVIRVYVRRGGRFAKPVADLFPGLMIPLARVLGE